MKTQSFRNLQTRKLSKSDLNRSKGGGALLAAAGVMAIFAAAKGVAMGAATLWHKYGPKP